METPRARYQQIADELREAIRQGVYKPGERLPSHPELANQYGVSRTLAKQATDILVAEGLVRAEQGRGVEVLAAPVAKRVRTIDRDYRSDTRRSSFADELRKAGLEPRTKLVRRAAIKPPGRIAEHLGIDGAEEVVVRERRMWAGDKPVQIATSYIPMSYAGSPDIALPDTGPSGIYARLAARGYGPVVFTEDIEVRGATKDEATFLEIPIGEPVYEVLRTAIDAEDRRVETCANVLAAKQWRLTYRWRQEAGEMSPATP
jgi:GntR family transcriptional regulator